VLARRLTDKADRVVDSHVHFRRLSRLEHFFDIRRHVGVDRMNIVCIVNPATGVGNARGIYAKIAGRGAIYCFGGLNHTTYKSGGKVRAPCLADQVDHLVQAGFDGVKLIEGKPSVRRDWYPFALDGDYYRDFFARAERRAMPIVWHVADPADFWESGKATHPDWAYGPEDVSKDALHAEVENVLGRHPKLRVILAHFSFLSGDLDRAGRLLRAHPNTFFDLALGDELLYNLSADPERSRRFLVTFQDRILYGTDTSDRNALSLAEQKAQAIRRLLETDETFTLPGRQGPGGRTEIRGLNLPDRVLAKVYAANFESIAGAQPKAVDPDKAKEYFQRCAKICAALTGEPPEQTVPGQCLAGLGHPGR